MVKKSKASKGSSGTKSGEGGKSKKQKKGSGKGSSSSRRKEARQELKEANKRPQKRAHGKEVDETRQRLRSKWLERQLSRGPGSRVGPERRTLLLEMAQLQLAAGRSKAALQSLREALDMDPEDVDFAVRGPLLCLYLDKAMAEEAASLLKGPLFEDAMQGDLPAEPSAKQREAVTAGCYSIALLSYISVRVVREYKKPKAVEEAEERLLKRLQKAHQQNPFIAEFLAFAPAFESTFPFGCELPEASGAEKLEEQLLEALRYCCQWGGRGQAPVWLDDTNATVRRFIRETLFEAEDASDAAPLAEASPNEAPVLQRWRRAREEAMQLWATEMAQEAGFGREEQMEEEVLTEDEEIRDPGH